MPRTSIKKTASKASGEPLTVAALERALLVLKAFEDNKLPLSLAQLSALTGLYKSTILRFLVSFEAHGHIRQLDDGKYTLGPAAFRLGIAYQKAFSLEGILLPVLEQLVTDGTESASFHIQVQKRRLCLYRVDSKHPTLDTIKPGDYLPLDRGAAGKVLRAYAPDRPDSLKDVRDQTLAYSHGERDPACAALAAPVFGRQGELIGAISLSGPKERFTKENISRMSQLLRAAARGVSDHAVSVVGRTSQTGQF